MLLDQRFLCVASFVGGSIVSRSRSGLCFGRQLRQFAFECLADDFVELRIALVGNLLQLGIHGGCFLTSFVGPQANQPGVGRSPVLPVVRRFKDRSHTIVVGLRDGIVSMIVALGTSDRKPEHGGRYDLDRIGDHIVAGEVLIDGAVACAVGAHSQHAGGDQPICLFGSEIRQRWRKQLVAGELFDEKLVPRFVVVESADHVVAIPVRPFARRIHSAVAVAVGVADDIQPMASPVLAIAGRGEQLVDNSLVGVGRQDRSRIARRPRATAAGQSGRSRGA